MLIGRDFRNCRSSGVVLANAQAGTKFIGGSLLGNNSQANGSNGIGVLAGVSTEP